MQTLHENIMKCKESLPKLIDIKEFEEKLDVIEDKVIQRFLSNVNRSIINCSKVFRQCLLF